MKILNTKRGFGKTTFLIILSAITNKKIICINKRQAANILAKSIDMHLAIPSPLTVSEIINGDIDPRCKKDGFLFDDYEYISQLIISETIGINMNESFGFTSIANI